MWMVFARCWSLVLVSISGILIIALLFMLPRVRDSLSHLLMLFFIKKNDVIKLLEKHGAKPLMGPMHANHAREVPEYEINLKELDFTNSVEISKLLLMKRGGELIYASPLGHKSSELISYFEAIEGVQKIRYGYNLTRWMLEVTSSAEESRLGVDFAEIYQKSSLYQYFILSSS